MSTEPEIIEGETTDYIVHVVTGTKPGAGTDANVFISIIGISLPTAYIVRREDYVLTSVCPSVCPHPGGGVPRPGPDGRGRGFPSQV